MGSLVLWWGISKAGAVNIIVNPGVPVSSITQQQLRAMFAMKLLQWPDGQAVRVFVLADDAPLHRAFSKELLGAYPYQLRQNWDRLVYSGTGQAPLLVDSEAEMLSQVARTPGALGYARQIRSSDRVRILSVDHFARVIPAQ